jgi:spore germination protein
VVAGSGKALREKSPELLRAAFTGDGALERHAAALLSAASRRGLELDYESVPARLWPRYVRLLQTLSRRLHAEGRELHLVLESGELFNPLRRGALEHWPAAARAADVVTVMAYYERGAFSPMRGPGASLDFVLDAARRAQGLIPREKLVIALSAASSDWKLSVAGRDRLSRLTWSRARRLMARVGAAPLWDARRGASYFRYRDERGGEREVWLEDERALRAKIEGLRRMGIQRVAIWYVGGEGPDLGRLCGRTDTK